MNSLSRLILLLFFWPASGQSDGLVTCSGEGYWPDPEWAIVKPVEMGLNPDRLQKWVRYVFRASPRARTDAVIVVHKGRIVFEKYARGYSRETRHNVWSVTKSLASGLIGRAEYLGLLQRDDPIGKYFRNLAGDEKGKIRVRDLLQMSSGLSFDEGYVNPFKSDVIEMLYGAAAKDMAGFTAQKPLIATPGQRFNYSSGETNLLMGVFKGAVPLEFHDLWPYKEFFAPLGMTSVAFEQDRAGAFVGSSYAFMTARDLARFGYLYLRKGCWKTRRILPEDWVSWSSTVAPSFYQTKLDKFNNHRSYGAGWWLNRDLPEKGLTRPFPSAPEDTFVALGHEGQSLYVLPSLHLVVVRLADDNLGGLIGNHYLELLLAALPSVQKCEDRAPCNLQRDALETTSLTEYVVPTSEISLWRKNLDLSLPFRLIGRLTAKELCSCHFVERQTRNFCVEKVRQYVPNFRVEVDEINRRVYAGLDYSTSARWISDRLGCQLEGEGP